MKLLTPWAGQLSVDEKGDTVWSEKSTVPQDGNSSIANDVERLFPPIRIESHEGRPVVVPTVIPYEWIIRQRLKRGAT